MKLFFSFLLGCCILFQMVSCKNTHTFDKYVKELDSLKIVVEQAVDNFKTVDSLTCFTVFNTQASYSKYINSNLKDTISKIEAENLQLFFATGKGLRDYTTKRQTWLNEAALTITQITALSHDLKQGAIEPEEAVDFINKEKKQAEKIIDELKLNTESVRECILTYNKSLPFVQSVLKRLNGGVLPTNNLK